MEICGFFGGIILILNVMMHFFVFIVFFTR